MGTITEAEVEGWMAKLQHDGVGTATINAAHGVLRAMLNVALRERIIARNPAVGVRAPKPPRVEMRFLNPQEIHAIADALMDPGRGYTICGIHQ
jgi:site-specific recombinase XerC